MGGAPPAAEAAPASASAATALAPAGLLDIDRLSHQELLAELSWVLPFPVGAMAHNSKAELREALWGHRAAESGGAACTSG